MRRAATHLPVDGGKQAWVGVNFWSKTGGPLMWRHYDGEVISAELAQLKQHGINLTRSFLYWPDFHPQPNELSEEMLANFADFLRRHEHAGVQTIPTFIVGHMSGENWDPVWRNGRDVFGDVWFVGRQAWYIKEVVRRFAADPVIAGWLLTNEVPIYADWQSRGVGTLDADDVSAWAQILIDAVRAGGGEQPVSIGDGSWGVEVTGKDNGFRSRQLEPLVDFLGPHVYRMEDDQVRQHLGAAFICELLDFHEKPVVLEEFGVTSDYVGEENAAHYYRQVLHNTLLAGATGWIPWNNVDYDAQAEIAPYSHHPFEMHFGLIDDQGRPKLQLLEVQKFAALLERVEFSHLHRPDTSTAILVSSFLEAMYPFTTPEDGPTVFTVARQSYVAAREADLPVAVVREADGVPEDVRLMIVPSTKALRADTWPKLVDRAENGALVYASYFNGAHANQRGSWWPKLDETFGVKKKVQYGLIAPVEHDTVTLEFLLDFGDIVRGECLTFAVGGTADGRSFLPVELDGAEVIAVDGDGWPALVRRNVGTGALILSTYPLEYFAASTPRVNPEPTARLYAALADEAGTTPEVTVESPLVLTGIMKRSDGRRFVWFVSQGDSTMEVAPKTAATMRTLDSGAPVATVRLGPFGVEVLELSS